MLMLPGSAVSLSQSNFQLRIRFAIHSTRFLQHEVYLILEVSSSYEFLLYRIKETKMQNQPHVIKSIVVFPYIVLFNFLITSVKP